MEQQFELIVRNGTIIDGLGNPPIQADIGIAKGRIAAIGKLLPGDAQEIDATGLIVTPGFVDIHTHYDGQAIWSQQFLPSSLHGVTTVVMGNCGVGFAPVKSTDHDRLVELMEGVEDIPGVALREGLDWDWESFPEFLSALERLPHDIDFATQLPHAALRLYVMGDRAQNLEKATQDDIDRMRAIATDAIKAGALGFTTSRSVNHRSVHGDPMPSLRATEEELQGIAQGLKDAGAGVLQMILDFDDPQLMDAEFAMMRRLAQESGRPLSYSLMQKHGNKDGWKRLLDLTAEAVAEGLPIKAQVAPRNVGVLLSLQGSRIVFSGCPSYKKIAQLPVPERIRRMQDPELRQSIIAEAGGPEMQGFSKELVNFTNIFPLGDPPEYDPGRSKSVAAIAAAQGVDPAQWAYDYLLQQDGAATLCMPFANYIEGNLDACEQMLADPNTVIGLGDGGAHVGLISDASFPTFLLSHWGRGSTKKFDLPWLVKKHTSDTAQAVGLTDRGAIEVGKKADLNVISLEDLALIAPRIEHDLPAGKGRLVQRADGYVATIVSGITVYRNGKPTGELPGKLVRAAVA